MSMNDYNPALEDYIRIPLQLRFERDDMFDTLIAPARADRSLTTLIQQLLQAYYRSQTVRDIIAQQSMGFTDIDVLAKQVDRVAKAHNNTRVLTGMVMDDVLDASDGLMPNTAQNNSGATGDNDIMTMLQSIATQVGSLSARIDKMESGSATPTTAPTVTTAEPVSTPVAQTTMADMPVQMSTATTKSMRTTANIPNTSPTVAAPKPVNKFAKLASSMANFG